MELENNKITFRDLAQLFWIFFKLGLFTIGGGMAMIPLVQDMMVTKYHWFDDEEVIDAIAVCQALPGVIAINMATFIGNKKQRLPGAIVATFGVVLPSFIIISLIVFLLDALPDNHYVEGVFTAIKACAAGLIAVAAWRIATKTVKDWYTAAIAVIVFAGITFLSVNAVFGVLFGAVCGLGAMAYHNQKQKKLEKECSWSYNNRDRKNENGSSGKGGGPR